MIREQEIKSMIKDCKKDKKENTLDDLIKGLQELRAEHGNLRVFTDYDCGYSVDPLTVQRLKPLKDTKDKVLGFCLVL